MDIIKTGLGISKTIRNVGRLKEIALVFAKHGFDEFISLGVTSVIPNFVLPKSKTSIKEELKKKGEKDWPKVLGHRLRLCFEELGPTFIKFGQLLSSREDIFDESFVRELKVLRDKVTPIPFSEVRSKVESSLGQAIDDVFESISDKPIGTASIGVVYKGKLKSGEVVVLKVKRPDIENEIKTDFSILRFLAAQAERVSDDVKFLGVSRIINDFSSSLTNELNFNTESLNCKRFRKILNNHGGKGLIYVPEVYEEYSRHDLLVMEYLDGVAFSNEEELAPYLSDLEGKLNEGLKVFIYAFFKEGSFHADLHGGNFFYLKNNQIGLIDFGLMGSLSKKGRKNFVAIIYALLNFNYENIVYEFLDVAEYEKIPDIDSLISDVREVLSPYIGLTVQQTDFTLLLKAVISALKKHQMFLPREWFIVFRGLMTLDGVGKSLNQDFDLYAMLEDDIHEVIKNTFSKDELIEEGVWATRDLASFGRVIPRHLKWYLKEWAKKGYAHEIALKGHERPLREINNSLVFLGFIVLSCVFIVSGVIFAEKASIVHIKDIDTIVWIFWCLGLLSLVKALRSLKKTM